MTTELPQDVMDAFAAADEAYANAGTDTGAGYQGEWPRAGEYTCFLRDITISSGTFRSYGDDTGVPCARVRFHWELVEPSEDEKAADPEWDPNDPYGGMTSPNFDGREMQCVFGTSNIAQLPEEQEATGGRQYGRRYQSDNRRDIERLRGNLCRLLNVSSDQLAASPVEDLRTLQDAIAAGTPPMATVKIHERKSKKGYVTSTDYVQGIESA